MALATSALMEIISRGQALQAVVLRNGSPDEQEAVRAAMHDTLDAYIDHTAAAATHARQIIEP